MTNILGEQNSWSKIIKLLLFFHHTLKVNQYRNSFLCPWKIIQVISWLFWSFLDNNKFILSGQGHSLFSKIIIKNLKLIKIYMFFPPSARAFCRLEGREWSCSLLPIVRHLCTLCVWQVFTALSCGNFRRWLTAPSIPLTSASLTLVIYFLGALYQPLLLSLHLAIPSSLCHSPFAHLRSSVSQDLIWP